MSAQFPSKTGAEAVAVITGSILSGAMMDLSMLAVPVLLDTNTQPIPLANQWARVYHYGLRLYPTMAVTTSLLYGYAARKKHAAGRPWRVFALAAATTFCMVPFTRIFMQGTNDALFRAQTQKVASWGDVQQLVTMWRGLHSVRLLFPLTGAVLGLLGTLEVLVF